MTVRMFYTGGIGLAVWSLVAATCMAGPDFYTYEAKHSRVIYYGEAPAYVVPYVARCLENSLRYHRRLLNYSSPDRVTVLLHDESDFGRAGVTAAPRNYIWLAVAPPDYAFETTPANEHVNTALNHEVTHLVANDMTAGADGLFRSLFRGKVRESPVHPETILYSYLTTPRRSAPRWFHEGFAVFMETWMAGGLGRVLGSYDEMVFRTLVRDSAAFYDHVGLEADGTETDFKATAISYMYGTRFISYLALKYGPESVLDWAARSRSSKAYFASQFRQVYGTSLDQEWAQWVAWERSFQQRNLNIIRQAPVTEQRPLVNRPLGAVSRAAYDPASRTLYVASEDPGQVAAVAALDIDSGTFRRLFEIKGPAPFSVSSLALHPDSGLLFYTTDNDDWRDLRVHNLHLGRTRTLIRDARVGDLAFDRRGRVLWGIRHANGMSTLVNSAPPYTTWHHRVTLRYGYNLYGLAVSPDGTRLTAGLSMPDGSHKLILMTANTAAQGDPHYTTLFDFGNSMPADFVWSDDACYLYGTSYYTGVSNVFRYDLRTKTMEAVSNCETGLFYPIPVSLDSLVVFAYTSQGYLPVMISSHPIDRVSATDFLGQQIVEQHPIVKQWMADSPGAIDADSITVRSGRYHGLQQIRLTSAYPVIEGYRDYLALGAHADLQDPIGLHNFRLTASATPGGQLDVSERLHLELGYTVRRWQLSFSHNDADFYDLFGPTRISRKGSSLGLRFQDEPIRDGLRFLRYGLEIRQYWGLKRLPEYQHIVTSFEQFVSLGASMVYSHLRASRGAVDHEKGYSVGVMLSERVVSRRGFSRSALTLDVGAPVLLRHSSLWLRSAVGYSPNDRREPLANFYMGGFGNNWIDHQSIRRYRRFQSFPGRELNEVNGTNFTRVMVEWTLPPLRFRRVGIPFLYARWLHPAIFATGLSSNIDTRADRAVVGNIGGQIDLRLMLLSHLRLTLSGGLAVAFERNRTPSHEWMLSLKVL